MIWTVYLVASLLILAVSIGLLRKGAALSRRGAESFKEAHEVFERAKAESERLLEERPLLRAQIEHKQDPVLRPLKLLVVRMPDADFEEVAEQGHLEPVDAVATVKGSTEAIAHADFAVAIWPDGHAKVLKWRDYPTDVIEPEAYVGG